MSWIEIAIGVALVVSALAIISVVLFQEAEQQNPGSINSGQSGTFFSHNESRSIDSFLKKWTKIISVSFFLLVLAINVTTFIIKKPEIDARKAQQEQQAKDFEENKKKMEEAQKEAQKNAQEEDEKNKEEE